jgi:hypothetical protein
MSTAPSAAVAVKVYVPARVIVRSGGANIPPETAPEVVPSNGAPPIVIVVVDAVARFPN